jgi:hypothetical protein
MLNFPDIEKFFPEFQLDIIEKDDKIKIRLASIFIDQPFYIIKNYSNKDIDFLKAKCSEEHLDMCHRIHHFYKGLCKHDPEKAKRAGNIEWTKFLKRGNITKYSISS